MEGTEGSRSRSIDGPAGDDAGALAASSGLLFTEQVNVGHAGPPGFVFLHGLGATHRYWTAATGQTWLPQNSLLVDLFGFGRSPRPLVRYSLDAHLAALDTVLAPRGRFTLVGHSLGAALALAYAAQHPQQIEALVLISLPEYRDRDAARRWLRPRPRGWVLTNIGLNALACIVTRRIVRPLLPRLLPDLPREVARDVMEHNFLSSTTSLWEVIYRHDLTADFERLPADLPVTLIHGDMDTTAPIESVQAMARRRPNSDLVVLKGVDHHPWLRRPADCSAALASEQDPSL